MILYDPTIPASLKEFGILIPINDSRASRTFLALLEDQGLQAIQSLWHRDQIVETVTKEDLLQVHSKEYVARLFSDELEQEIISTYELIDARGNYYRYAPDTATRPLAKLFERTLLKAAGTYQGAKLAMEHGFSYCFTGGAHHAQYNYGNGFCVINDIVIAARKLQAEQALTTVWVIDVDAHKGDGTAALTEHDDTICTLSVHMARGWPLDGAKTLPDGTVNPSFIASDIDISIESGEEDTYIPRLHSGLIQLDQMGYPDLAIVVCGADPYEHDELPSAKLLQLTLKQMLERDRLLYSWLHQREIPALFLAAGGYGDDVWRVYEQFLRWVLQQRFDHLL